MNIFRFQIDRAEGIITMLEIQPYFDHFYLENRFSLDFNNYKVSLQSKNDFTSFKNEHKTGT